MDDATALAAGFDLRALPLSFYDDPFPTYRASRAMRAISSGASTG